MDVDTMLYAWRDRNSGVFEDTASLHAVACCGLRSYARRWRDSEWKKQQDRKWVHRPQATSRTRGDEEVASSFMAAGQHGRDVPELGRTKKMLYDWCWRR